ncbi:MAG: T9SS type A sorting domain-containing protein [Ignavibacteriales bacterium]|nr:T9SS type A sorting domain-containing protein [Ignavibacteriales bacterium]
MKFLLSIVLLFFSINIIDAQEIFEHYENYKPAFIKELEKKKKPVFQRLETNEKINPNNSKPDFYPLNTGDFWEYIEEDTTTLFNNKEYLKFSYIKEIIGDTLMPNGISYKVIREGKYCNSINEKPSYSYQRKDSTNKIYIYYDDKDSLLFDYPLKEYTFYISPYPDKIWRIDEIYNVAAFGDTLQAIDISLIDTVDWYFEYNITLVENFGIINYKGRAEKKELLQGSFFGGIIKDITYGYLLAKRQKIDWNEFYPLHVGDYWVYLSFSGTMKYYTTSRVTGDTLLPDGNRYFVFNGSTFVRNENNVIYSWQNNTQSSMPVYKFSSCLGDTIKMNQSFNKIQRINNKNYNTIYFFRYPDMLNDGIYFTRGLGLTESTIEGGGSYLIGAYINGKLYGDTTVTNVEYEDNNTLKKFELYQNYPNPFNPTTVISYQLSDLSDVKLKIYDVLGREVAMLVNKFQKEGKYLVNYNADGLSSGVYFYQLTTGSTSVTKKMVLIR